MSTNEEITEWLNRQNEWIREAAHRLLSKGSLDDRDIDELAALAKKPEPKPKEKLFRAYPVIGGSNSSAFELHLESIGTVIGIDALNPTKPLEFGDGNLSVVYGANGSGKSGYTRIISRVCGKPHSADLRANVYEGVPATQQCTIRYSLSGVTKAVDWFGAEDPIDELKEVNVFDADSGRIYLEKDNELSYDLPELAIFTALVEACKRVEAALTAEQQQLTSKLPDLLAKHAVTRAGKAYASLAKDIPPSKVTELVMWTEVEEAALKSQQERVKIADPTAAAKRKREEKKQIEAVRVALQRGISALGEKALDAIERLKKIAASKRNAAREGAVAIGDTTRLDGIGSTTWKAMWEAARTYSNTEAYSDHKFPHTSDGARCLLCQQDLDEKAQSRLQGFEEFVKGTIEKEATEAEDLLKESLEFLPIRPTPEALTTACQAAGLEDELHEALESAWSNLEPFLVPLRKGILPGQALLKVEEVSQLLTRLDELAAKAEKFAEELESDAKSPDRKDAILQVSELKGKKWVTEQAAAIKAEVSHLSKRAEYHEWKRKTNTTGISRKAGELSETLITEAYVQRFNEELIKLGAHKIRVELVKTATAYGKPMHGIRLRDPADMKAQVAGVLSEGERRIVALAAFIADATGQKATSPLVFDDPVSSLDQIFEEKVISRLVELSTERQVLIFTHRLSFLGMMNDLTRGNLKDVHIRRESWGTGQPGEIPLFGRNPVKALNILKDQRLPKARKAFENDGHEAYYPLAKAICSDFRILMERTVEYVLLDEVVLRYRRSVQTMNRIGKLAKISAPDCELIDSFMTKYSCYEHSQSDEAPVEVPEPVEIKNDIVRMLDWHKDFSDRPIN